MMTDIIVTNGVTAVAPANANRTWAIIENLDVANSVYLQLGNVTTGLTTSNGLRLSQGAIISLSKSSPLSSFGFTINAISSITAGVELRYQDDT